MNEPWLKLYKKIAQNPIIHDHKALAVFIWLLATADSTGTKTVSRYLTALSLKMKPATFYDVLKRLKEKYKVIEVLPKESFTEIKLLHWYKYQSHLDNTEDLPKSNRRNTEVKPALYKEYKKEYKNKIQKVITPYNPPLNVLEEIAEKYGVPLTFVKFQLETLQNYIASTGKVYKDPTAALKNFVLRDMRKMLEKTKLNGGNYGFTDASKL